MYEGTIKGITEVLQQGYGDNTSGPLDRAVANQILSYFINNGWAGPDQIAYMVKSAGGEIRVKGDSLLSDPPILSKQHDFMTDEYVFRTIEKPDTSTARVNPNAEQRDART